MDYELNPNDAESARQFEINNLSVALDDLLSWKASLTLQAQFSMGLNLNRLSKPPYDTKEAYRWYWQRRRNIEYDYRNCINEIASTCKRINALRPSELYYLDQWGNIQYHYWFHEE